MKKLFRESILSSVILLFLFCSCSKTHISSRQITDFSGLEAKVRKQHNFRSSNILKIKFKTVIETNGRENKLTGRIFSFSDTCLYVSVMSSSLGIEVAQAVLKSDSITIINKYEKNYFSGTYADIKTLSSSFRAIYSFLTSSYLSDTISFNSSNAHYQPNFNRFIVNTTLSENSNKSFVTTIFDVYGNLASTEYKSYNGDIFRAIYSNFALSYGFPAEMVLISVVKGSKSEYKILFENVSVANGNLPDLNLKVDRYKRVSF
ncbi:MAG: DUF4292 domain-containing protein [Salinivirgaceae bacterium]|nr:DUF4292 domain-containing protein [Salinivirgaceae bacterium]